MTIGETAGQGWLQIGELAFAFLLSGLIGLEREMRQKSAGLRTYTLVGFASALIIIISKYGFTNILANDRVVLDPSRIAAQIVSGIGFIGGGVIFVRRDIVRGLTTAATIWLTAAVGMACGAGLPVLALFVTAGHFVAIFAFPVLVRKLPKSRWTPSLLHVSYLDGRDVLSDILVVCTDQDFAVSRLRVERTSRLDPEQTNQLTRLNETTEQDDLLNKDSENQPEIISEKVVTAVLEVTGVRSIAKLAAKVGSIKGVVAVNAGDVNVISE